MKPDFPIRVKFADGEEWKFSDEHEAEITLEWFDSDQADEEAQVFDAQGRPVRLKVEELTVRVCEVICNQAA
jgi:hypothetical protein